MKLKEIIKRINGKLICGDSEYICEGFSKDTRNINYGDTYIGIKGEKFDGSMFWKEAIDKGASTVIISDTVDLSGIESYAKKNIVLVKDVLESLYEIAKYKRSLYDIPVVAVTGSVGKTSTKDIIANVLSQKYNVHKTEGNYNNNIGLPFTILGLRDENALVLEMGMNHLGEIELLSEIAKPTLSVIVNVGSAHIGNLGSRENILKAKLEILSGMDVKKVIVNNDNDLLNRWAAGNNENIEILTFGIDNKSQKMAEDILISEERSIYSCEGIGKVKIPVTGEHFILNSLASILVGEDLGLNTKEIVSGVEGFQLTKKRMDIDTVYGVKIINDAYNASFESVVAAFKTLDNYKESRKIAVVGDIFELGDHARKIHENIGEEFSKTDIDMMICAGENARYIYERIDSKAYYMEKDKIVEKLLSIVKKGDVVLFKASNGMKFYELAEELKTRLK